jgi:hypothetical protein
VSPCSRNSAGQVATTIVVAQITPLRKGNSVHRLPDQQHADHENRQHDPRDIGGRSPCCMAASQ